MGINRLAKKDFTGQQGHLDNFMDNPNINVSMRELEKDLQDLDQIRVTVEQQQQALAREMEQLYTVPQYHTSEADDVASLTQAIYMALK